MQVIEAVKKRVKKIHPKHAKYELGEPIKVFTISRRSFLHYYFFVVAVLIIIVVLFIQGRLNLYNGAALGFLAYFVGHLPELKRFYTHYKIMPRNVQKITGILKKNREKIMMSMIGRMDIYQSPIQRLLNYGSVKIKSLTGEQILEFHNIKNPRKVTHMIEKLVKIKTSGVPEEKMQEQLEKIREEF